MARAERPARLPRATLLAGPSAQHLLGANDVGQDNLSLLLYGARVSLLVGALVGICSTAIAWLAGLSSGLSRRADWLVTFAADLLLAVPGLLLILLIVTYLGADLVMLIAALSLASWGAFARVLRGLVQAELRKPYVESARAMGASALRIAVCHIAPATLPTVAVKFVLTVQYAVVVQASLAFLGLGDATTISWGGIAHRAALSPEVFLGRAWLWWLLPPALAVAALVLGFALIGWAIEERRLAGPVRRAAAWLGSST